MPSSSSSPQQPLRGFAYPPRWEEEKEDNSSSSSGNVFSTPALSAVYSLHLQPSTSSSLPSSSSSLLAAAGKQGQMAIFQIQRHPHKPSSSSSSLPSSSSSSSSSLLLSFRGHTGWVADVRFLTPPSLPPSLPSSASPSVLLASAANDGVVKLWDLARVHPTTGMPKALASLNVSPPSLPPSLPPSRASAVVTNHSLPPSLPPSGRTLQRDLLHGLLC